MSNIIQFVKRGSGLLDDDEQAQARANLEAHYAEELERLENGRSASREYEPEAPAAPVEKPAPAPVKKPAAKRPETVSNDPAPALYFVYAKLPGAKSFALADMAKGRVGVRRFYAPVYNDSHLDKLKDLLDEVAGENPGHAFQIRTTSKRPKIIYTAVPTVTPEQFAASIAA